MIQRLLFLTFVIPLFSLLVDSADARDIVSGNAVSQLGATPPAPPEGFATAADVVAALKSGQVQRAKSDIALPETIEELKDIEYGNVQGRSLKLDVYRPKTMTQSAPAIIFVHGGSWRAGKKENYRRYCIRYAQQGYVTVTISYRLTQEAPYPAAVNDTKCAVRWVRANAENYNVDPDNIVIMGGSAGGHLAMMAAYSSDIPALEGDGGHAGVSSRVQAVVNLYGPTDLTVPFAHDKRVVINFLGKKQYQDAPDLWAEASPISYVTADDPPTLILHGTIDTIVPIDQADRLATKLAGLKIPYIYDRLPGWTHSMDSAQPVTERCFWFIDRFLKSYAPIPE